LFVFPGQSKHLRQKYQGFMLELETWNGRELLCPDIQEVLNRSPSMRKDYSKLMKNRNNIRKEILSTTL